MPRAALLLALASLAGCKLLSPGVPCENDSNCPELTTCVEHVCVERVDGGDPARTDAGPRDDAGPGDRDSGPAPDDAGPDPQDSGPLDGGFTPPPFDAGPLACPAPASATIVFTGDIDVYADDDLSALGGVERIDGNLTLYNGSFTDLSFPDLLEVTGSIYFRDPGDGGPLLDPSFPCLQVIGSRLDVYGTTWSDPVFPALTTTGGDVDLRYGIESATFPRLSEVYDLELHVTLLSDLTGFPALRTLNDDLTMSDNDLLTSLDDLALASIGGRVDLTGHELLADLGTVTSLAPGEGRLSIRNNPALSSCEVELWRDELVFQHGARDVLSVEYNDDTDTCAAADPSGCAPTAVEEALACDGGEQALLVLADGTLGPSTTCTGTLTVGDGAVDVCAPSLVQVTGDLVIDSNTLQTVHLPALRVVTGNVLIITDGLEVLDLRRLRSAANLDVRSAADAVQPVDLFLPSLQTVGSLDIQDVGGDLFYLPALDTVDGAVFVRDSPGPADLWMPDLDSVAGRLELGFNDGLVALYGMRGLDSVGADVLIQYHPLLESLADLYDLNSVTGFADIHFNDRLVALPPNDMNVGSYVSVHDNGCLTDADALAWGQAVSTNSEAYTNGGGTDCPTPPLIHRSTGGAEPVVIASLLPAAATTVTPQV